MSIKTDYFALIEGIIFFYKIFIFNCLKLLYNYNHSILSPPSGVRGVYFTTYKPTPHY